MELFGDKNALSCIKDPFSLSCIQGISIRYCRTFFSGNRFLGTIEFEKDNTKAEQRFEGKSLTDVFLQVKAFCDELENKDKKED